MGNGCTKSPGSEAGPSSKSRAANMHGSIIDISGNPVKTPRTNDYSNDAASRGQASEDGENTHQVPRLKNIFAAPVKVMSDFVFPVYDKSDADRQFIESVVKDNFIFAGVDAGQLTNLLNAFEEFNVSDGTQIITEGEVGDFFYILQNGSVKFTVNGENVGEASDGGSFGDLALLYDCPRAATCTATGDCKLWRVDQNAFRQILANSTLNKDRAVLDTLKKVPFLKALDIEYLNKIANSVETKKFAKNAKIIKKGDKGLEFFVVKEGSVSVEDIESGGRHYDNQTLTEGDYFGERAIVKEEPRAANVIALTDVTTLTLSRETFLEVVGPLESLMRKTNDLMVLKGIPAFARSDVKDPEYKALASRIVYTTVPNGQKFYSKGDTKGAGIYFLHSGKAKVEGSKKEVTEGGYFGLDTILSEQIAGTLYAEGDCEVGFLSKDTVEYVIVQMSRIYEGARRKPLKKSSSSVMDAIPLSKLKKHRILGIGTFGKVWLVTNGDSKDVFALKIQRKRVLLQHQQVEGVIREMKVMSKLDHPFVLKLMNVYQNSEEVLMLVKLIQGGELYSIMKRHRRNILPERDAKFYASGILEGLSFMHSYSILYRDLKPENVLIGKDGYPVIVDLGFAKEVPDKTFTLCGTPWYIAPEVILGRGHDRACDHWSWAILVHEMVSGDTPFAASGSDQMTLFKAIVRGNYKISKRCNDIVKDLVEKVLVTRPTNRLGSLANAEQGLKTHPWLIDVDFDKLRQKRFRAPWKPNLKDALDVSEFDNWDHMELDEKLAPLSSREQQQFLAVDDVSRALLSRS
eukprot:CAMPEP_0203668606 /NCGR_PEP_ID=MMETSP0090-20130426/5191_1 /ASSEMBLY_ACC=CAM_ASM_001088 /TAXON_ID=426623 /ORGANISM="Chaetoceros affinis, Strain CCMP159" /LENGTH=800 /DNA_ID=CAMNT_0050533093 /DNA_START=124 /DNA_END=2526 /DNA_ORIENTATION=-